MLSKEKRPEILAPVGHIDAFYAAIKAGCDALYLGGLDFGARDYAKNFDHDTLIQIVRYAHLRNVRVYYTLNTLIKDIEYKKLDTELKFLDTLCLDGLIIQDLGVFEYIRKNYPTFILHGSTQLNIHNVEDARFFYELGFERVVLARECQLGDVEAICSQVPIEVETFVHGALCYAFSGQCFMSSFYGGRSGNRGKCAGPCRLPFTVDNADGYFLSMKDQMTLSILPQLILAGIDSFKIEGRMKNADYVFHATRLYRKYRELALTCIHENRVHEYSVEQKDINLLKVIYNRGDFTQGYYYAQPSSQISIEHPKHLGLKVGSARLEKQSLTLTLHEPLTKGDVLEWHVPTEYMHKAEHPTSTLDMDWTQKQLNLKKNLPIVKEILALCKDKKISFPIYKIYDPAFSKDYYAAHMAPITWVDVQVKANVGEPLTMHMIFIDDQGMEQSFHVEGFVVEPAKKRPLDEQQLKKQINKMDEQVFQFNKIDVSMGGDGFVPLGAINQLRRDGVALLEAHKLKMQWEQRKPYQLKNLLQKQVELKKEDRAIRSQPQIRVRIATTAQWKGLKASCQKEKKAIIERIYIDYTDMRIDEINSILIEKESIEPKAQFYLALPHVVLTASKKKMLEDFKQIDMQKIDGFLVRSLGQIELLKAYQKPLASDYNLHAFNQESANFLSDYFDTVTLSIELNARGMEDIIKQAPKLDIEWISYGHIALMHSGTCVYKSRYGKCDYTSKGHSMTLQDRKQEVQHVMCHCKFCYTTIYNAKATNLLDYTQQLKGKHRIEFTYESEEEVYQKMIELYRNNTIGFDENKMTKGHIQRGVK